MDEAPQAYKNLVEVMVAQADLGAVLGRFNRRHASCEWPTRKAVSGKDDLRKMLLANLNGAQLAGRWHM